MANMDELAGRLKTILEQVVEPQAQRMRTLEEWIDDVQKRVHLHDARLTKLEQPPTDRSTFSIADYKHFRASGATDDEALEAAKIRWQFLNDPDRPKDMGIDALGWVRAAAALRAGAEANDWRTVRECAENVLPNLVGGSNVAILVARILDLARKH